MTKGSKTALYIGLGVAGAYLLYRYSKAKGVAGVAVSAAHKHMQASINTIMTAGNWSDWRHQELSGRSLDYIHQKVFNEASQYYDKSEGSVSDGAGAYQYVGADQYANASRPSHWYNEVLDFLNKTLPSGTVYESTDSGGVTVNQDAIDKLMAAIGA